MLYQLLGQATVLTVNEYFYTPATAQLLLENVFGSVSTMSNMHWSHLLSLFIKDAITHCPEAYFDVFLGALLPDVISFVDSKLEVEWQNVVVKGLLEVNTGEPNVEMEMNSPVETSIVQLPDQSIGTAVSDELIYQQSVRDLTRKFCDIWVAVFLQLKGMSNMPEYFYGITWKIAEPASDENAKPATLVSVQSSTAASTKLKPAPDFGQNNALAFYLLRNKVHIQLFLER
jgi:hypothetical protein